MEDILQQIEYRGFNINIYSDDFPLDPCKDEDIFGEMVCCHSRYNLGHKQAHSAEESIQYILKEVNYTQRKFKREEELENDSGYLNTQDFVQKYLGRLEKFAIILPLYLYDHSGITISTTPFSCRWDSGQIGFLFVSKEKARNEFGRRYIKKAIALLKREAEYYDQYLRGEIYRYQIEPKDTNKKITCDDSCSGFYGHKFDENGLLENAKGSIDYAIKEYRDSELKKFFERKKILLTQKQEDKLIRQEEIGQGYEQLTLQ